MRPDFLSPIMLGGLFGQLTAEGSNASLNPVVLTNPNKAPMLIDEFVFTSGPTSGAGLGSGWQFAYLCADLKMGGIPLTKGYVPTVAMAHAYMTGAQGSPAATNAVNINQIEEPSLTWHLPRPLYVPPGVGILANFMRRTPYPIAGNPSMAVPPFGFWARGRSMPENTPPPKKIWVPWATYSQCRQQVTRFVTGDYEMSNPHDTPLCVTQFLGWNANQGGTTLMISSPFTVQATFSNNKMFIRDPTPFGLLFPTDRGYFNTKATLMPGQFARFELEVVPANAETLEGTTLGMIGYREVQTPWGAR